MTNVNPCNIDFLRVNHPEPAHPGFPTTRCRWAHILRCSGLLFTPRSKLLMISSYRITSGILFVECFCHCSPVLARSSTEEDNSHPLHLVSQDSAQEFLNGFLPSYLGALPTEFQEYCLQIPCHPVALTATKTHNFSPNKVLSSTQRVRNPPTNKLFYPQRREDETLPPTSLSILNPG